MTAVRETKGEGNGREILWRECEDYLQFSHRVNRLLVFLTKKKKVAKDETGKEKKVP